MSPDDDAADKPDEEPSDRDEPADAESADDEGAQEPADAAAKQRPSGDAGEDPSRRRFLKVGIHGLGAGVAAITAVPAVAFLTYPLGHATVSGSDAFIPAGRADTFKPREPVKVDLYADRVDAWNRVLQVKVGSAWIVKEGDQLVAYTTVCPHLGCAVDWDVESARFKCPCHRSAFSVQGEVEEGPSPRPLDRLDVEVKDGLLAVKYQRFKQGIPEKVVG